MSDTLRRATFRVGQAGLNGTGITAGEKTALTNDTTALKAATVITQSPSTAHSAEQSLGALTTGLLKNTVTTGTGVLSTAVAADLPSHNHTATVGGSFLIDGGGATITTGVKGDLVIPFDGTITAHTSLADQTGSINVGVWRSTYAAYPPVVGGLAFTVAIAGSIKNQAGVSIAVAAGDILRFNVNSVTSIQRLTIALNITRTV